MADDRPVKDLIFRPCQRGFVFYDDHRFAFERGEESRAWAFDTVEAAAEWLVEQFAGAGQPEEGSAESHRRLRKTR